MGDQGDVMDTILFSWFEGCAIIGATKKYLVLACSFLVTPSIFNSLFCCSPAWSAPRLVNGMSPFLTVNPPWRK